MSDIITMVSQLGFPIAVAIYALYNSRKHEEYLQDVLNSTIKENTEAVNKLSELVDHLILK